MPRIYRKMLFALFLALLTTCLSTSLTFAQGGSWAIVSSPNQGTLGNQLFGVAAFSDSDIWAVGDIVSNSGFTTFAGSCAHGRGRPRASLASFGRSVFVCTRSPRPRRPRRGRCN